MLKEVRYTGFTAVPNDYDSPDGQLANSFNLLNEDGALRPLFPPKVLLTLPAGSEIIFIHKTAAFTHLIIRDTSTSSIQWLDAPSLLYRSEAVATESSPVSPDEPIPLLSTATTLSTPVSIGNTLIILTTSALRYFLWKPDERAYADLGSSIPFPEISFALADVPSTSSIQKFFVQLSIPGNLIEDIASRWFPSSTAPGSGASRPHGSASIYRSPDYKTLVADASTAVLAGLNKYIADAYDDGLFTEPFFIRYALRLFDGSHVMHSAPVLMIPNSAGPLLPFTPSLKDSTFSADTNIIHSRCSLLFRILQADMAAWTDIVTHIDIFISAPIYTFDQSGSVDPYQPAEAPAKFSHSGYAARRVNTSRTDPAADADILFSSGNYERPVTLPAGSGMEWNIGYRSPSDLADAISSQAASLFYLVSSIETAKLAPMQGYNYVDLHDKSLRNIQTRTRLADDYQSHHTRFPSLAHVYNSRLNLTSVTLRPFPGFALPAMTPLCKPATSSSGYAVKIYVRLRRDGLSLWTATAGTHVIDVPLSESYFPRWLFYPDSSAVEMLIAEYSGTQVTAIWLLPLATHDFLEGAYWLRGLGSDLPDHITGAEAAAAIPETISQTFYQPNKIYTSEVNNPFFFPVTGINTVGTGRILGISSAAKALSQGQFGQFPLYAFSEEGVWALEVSASGGFSAKQPITRDVCLSAESITQIDSAVLFATDRGIMLISGSQTQCISDVLNSPDFFDFSSLPGLLNLCGVAYPDCPFTEYIRRCRMAYDYVRQRIIVFNPDKDYAYVYSMKTKLWGIQECSLTSVVNAYPEAYAMSKVETEAGAGNALVDLSRTDSDEVRCLLISRPLKLDSPDILKTVTTVIQRGILPKHIRTVLYGTRDYTNWHLVSSSRSSAIRSFRGSPYKAFRIVADADMRDGNSIAGCSLDVIPRLTNRLR